MNKVIDSFSGKYDFLSNFYPSEISWNNMIWPTVEHAYQAFKTDDSEKQEEIRLASTPSIAKKLGREVLMRKDWNDIKLGVMRALVSLKFEDPILRKKLLDTANYKLIEGNYWGDTYWGICRGKGKNKLGEVLMEVRHRIRLDIEFERSCYI